MNNKIIGYALAIFAALGAVNAQAFTITFEDVPYSMLGHGPAHVNPYNYDGFQVDFNWGATYTPQGANVAITSDLNVLPTGSGLGQFYGDIYATFNRPASDVSIKALTTVTNDTIRPTLTAFDSFGQVIGSTSYKYSDAGSMLTTLSFSGTGIRSIRLSGQSPTYVMGSFFSYGFPGIYDDLTITPEVAPVPVPASAWLLLSGLGGLGFMSRKRKA